MIWVVSLLHAWGLSSIVVKVLNPQVTTLHQTDWVTFVYSYPQTLIDTSSNVCFIEDLWQLGESNVIDFCCYTSKLFITCPWQDILVVYLINFKFGGLTSNWVHHVVYGDLWSHELLEIKKSNGEFLSWNTWINLSSLLMSCSMITIANQGLQLQSSIVESFGSCPWQSWIDA